MGNKRYVACRVLTESAEMSIGSKAPDFEVGKDNFRFDHTYRANKMSYECYKSSVRGVLAAMRLCKEKHQELHRSSTALLIKHTMPAYLRL